MLACIDRRGELQRLFWPHIDYPQHIESFKMGIFTPGLKYSTHWLHDNDDNDWEIEQKYIKDTNILVSEFTNKRIGLKVECKDFALTDKARDICVRSVEVENISEHEKNLDFIIYSNFIGNTADLRSTIFDFDADCLVHYKPNYYFAVSANTKATGFQIGNNPMEAAIRSELYGIDYVGMTGEAAISFEIGGLVPGEKKSTTIFICCADTLKKSVDMLKKVREEAINSLLGNVESYWADFLNSGRIVETGNKELNELYKRSLLVFKLMSDESSGGLLAAPEVDENFTKCGRYAYCWGRDAAFITSALDKAGYSEMVSKFYNWAMNAQCSNGAWQQRYHMDGNLAPSWGLQIDETGTLIWGMLQHYNVTKDREFLAKMWYSVVKAADFLVEFIEPKNGLPKPSYDLWEERIGQHTYSAAAVCAGLKAAVNIGAIVEKKESQIINKKMVEWNTVAEGIEDAIKNHLWDSERNVLLRGLNSSVEGWGFEGHGGKREIVTNPFGYKKWVSAKDIMIDISILGVSVPFRVMRYDDDMVKKTANKIEEVLTEHSIGGLRRYETDSYMGGNPWILTTLWMALYHVECSNFDKALEYLEWTTKHKTYLGLMPEQVDKKTGDPAWVIPLTWSHAMFVIVYLELAKRGKI